MTVQSLVDSLLHNTNQAVTVRGVKKEIVGFAEFRTVNLGDDGYFKIIFDDHSFLFIVPSEDALFYTEEPPTPFGEISDADIGTVDELMFRDRAYELENADDYQYVVRLITGDYQSIEGEVRFSDYVPKDGADELLSLGWIVRTGERADVNPKRIDVGEIEVEGSA